MPYDDYTALLENAKQEKRKDDLQEKFQSLIDYNKSILKQLSLTLGVLDELSKLTSQLLEIERAKIKRGESFESTFRIPAINTGTSRLIYFDFEKGNKPGGSKNVKELVTQNVDYPYSKCFAVVLSNNGPAPVEFKMNPKGPADNRISGTLRANEFKAFASDLATYTGVNLAIDKSDTTNFADVEVFSET